MVTSNPQVYTPQTDPAANEDRRSFLLRGLPKNAVCAEIGVWKGDFAQRILAVTQPRDLHLIDPWLYMPTFTRRFYGGLEAKSQSDMERVYQGVVQRFQGLRNVHLHRATSAAAAATFDDAHFDWVYIDGDHSYDQVLHDLCAWVPKTKAGGLVAGDDVHWPGEDGTKPVRRAVQDFLTRHRVDEIMIKNNQFIILTDVPGA